MSGQDLTVNRHFELGMSLPHFDSPGQRHLAVAMVMAIGLAIGGNRHIVGFKSSFRNLIRKILPIVKVTRKGHSMGKVTVIHKIESSFPDGSTTLKGRFERSPRPSAACQLPSGSLILATCWGARRTNLISVSATASSVGVSTAASGSQSPSALRPNRLAKSANPHANSVRLSRSLQSGKIE